MIKTKVVSRNVGSVAERTFLPEVVKGLATTAKHFFENVVARRETATVQYPEEKAPYPERYRGLHRLMLREDGSPRCVACMMCPTVCPAHCITIVAEDTHDRQTEKRPRIFEIDELRCIVCGLCVEACPCDAIRMDTGTHMWPVTTRGNAVLGKVDLMKRGAPSTAVQGGDPQWRDRSAGKRDPLSKDTERDAVPTGAATPAPGRAAHH